MTDRPQPLDGKSLSMGERLYRALVAADPGAGDAPDWSTVREDARAELERAALAFVATLSGAAGKHSRRSVRAGRLHPHLVRRLQAHEKVADEAATALASVQGASRARSDRAIDARPEAAEVAGWVLVPREPDGAMKMAGAAAPRSEATTNATNTLERHLELTGDIYRAMLSAAPHPEGGRDGE